MLTSSNVGNDGNLRSHFDVAEQESPEETCEWTLPPFVQRVEDKLVTSVGISRPHHLASIRCIGRGDVLLPPSKFVINR
jgi:hypothetical protein